MELAGYGYGPFLNLKMERTKQKMLRGDIAEGAEGNFSYPLLWRELEAEEDEEHCTESIRDFDRAGEW